MKKIFLILVLILGIFVTGVTSFAEGNQIEVQIVTRPDGKRHEGTDSLVFEVYDLTEWRDKQVGGEKNDKEFILNTCKTKEKLASFIKSEQLEKYNQEGYRVDDQGNANISLPRYQKDRDAAYLILATGVIGKYQMVPIVVYLPQLDGQTKEEISQLTINCKFDEISKNISTDSSIPDDSRPRKDKPKKVVTQPVGERSLKSYPVKVFPSTNELLRNYCNLGLLFVVVGFVGLNKKGGKRL